MPSVAAGIRTTQDLNTETRLGRDVLPAILKLEPDKTPLTVFMGKLRKAETETPLFEWFEDERLPEQDTLAASVASGDTSITVSNYLYFRGGDVIILMDSGEQLLVTATPTSSAVTVTRAWGEVVAAAVANGGNIRILTNANQENALGRDILSTVKTNVFNYVGIIRDPFGVSNTSKVTKSFAGMDFEEEAANMLVQHAVKIERANLEGQRFQDLTPTNGPIRATRGLSRWITTNVTTGVGDLTEAVWDNQMRRVFRYGSKTKVALNAPIATQAISGWAKSRLRPSDVMLSKYGMNVTQYFNPFGTLLLVNHNLFTNDDLNDFSSLAGTSLWVDLANVRMRHMKGRISVRNENIQENDRDGRRDEYLTEQGLECGQQRTHGKMTGITG